MASVFKPKGQKSKKWRYRYKDYDGRWVTRTGVEDKQATAQIAAKMETDAELKRRGLIDPKAVTYAAAESRPLQEQIDDFHATLAAKGNTKQHTDLVRSRVVKLLSVCRCNSLSDMTAAKVQKGLGLLRESGLSLQSCNHHLRAIKQFSRWLWQEGRAREHVLAHLKGFNVRLDRRHDRRALTDDEIGRLLATTYDQPAWRGILGPERAMLYRLALETGLRASELASLTPKSFALADRDNATISVEAGYSKRRRDDVLPLQRDMAEAMVEYLRGRPLDQPAFRVPKGACAAMLRRDLAAADIPYRDASGRVADFHALRHTFITRLVRSGVSPAAAMSLARHSTIKLTIDHYTHTVVEDQRAALAKVRPITGRDQRQDTKATGTDG